MSETVPLESYQQGKIIKNLKRRKKSFTHKHCPDPVGYPDVEHLERGVLYLFEVKRTADDEPTPIQKLRHKQLKKAGAKVYVVLTWKEVKEILDAKRK